MINFINNDLTFITNEKGRKLVDRFNTLIKDTRFFDILVGYFYTSGFYTLYKSLENTEKIRILIGIGANKEVYEIISKKKKLFSHMETEKVYSNLVEKEFENSEDTIDVEKGIKKFIEWIKTGKLEIRAYPSQNIHAKVYIMTFTEKDRDVGRVITGSSNFTYSGMSENLEFNVELKNRADYEFAKQKFEKLWFHSVDVSKKYIQTVKEKTWFNSNISPYELYLKFLYEYFKDELNTNNEMFFEYFPEKFKKLEYQEQAVLNAKRILEEYGGVFISDVVGLGKTYISAMLISQLDGRTLVIAPPTLIKANNHGSWPNVFSDFRIAADCRSIGELDKILKNGTTKYKNVIVDESHRFRNENTVSYEKLAEICRGKRVILVTATPYNNSPKDLLNQIKLFQKAHKSTIPNLPDLERFFNQLEKRLKNLDRQKNYDEYIKIVRKNAKEIREKVLKYLMVRRTRNEITKYFSNDLKKQGLKFPEIKDPIPLFYQLNKQEDKIFNETIRLISQEFSYARYTPLLSKYFKGKIDQLQEQSQKNMSGFMKILLVKRLESSFYAFKQSINRFIDSYEIFIKSFEKGKVYISKDYSSKIFQLLLNDDDYLIQKMLEEGKAYEYTTNLFNENFIGDLKKDLKILTVIKSSWEKVKRDPKILTFINEISSNEILKNNKIIVFTESKETAEYLTRKLNDKFGEIALCYTGSAGELARKKVIENFDAKSKNPRDNYKILIATDALSEGVNLHRSNVVVNYDIPWNPTRMMQRVGRINRVDTEFDEIYTFNFFPTKQANSEIKLKEAATAKINAFLTLLGGDAALLTEGEPINSYELFNRLISKKSITEEEDLEESELKYLNIIKDIRDTQPLLFEKIKYLPKKARTSKVVQNKEFENSCITFFRKGKIEKFILSKHDKTIELDFVEAAKVLESKKTTSKEHMTEDFYELLQKNKEKFKEIVETENELPEISNKGRNSIYKLLKILKITMKNSQKLTEEQEAYLKLLKKQLEEGCIPKSTIRRVNNSLKKLGEEIENPLRVISVLEDNISNSLLQEHYINSSSYSKGRKEVILSMYLKGENEL